MSATRNIIIIDEKHLAGPLNKLVHVIAMNVIVLFRHEFGHRYFSPVSLFLVAWLMSTALSAGVFLTTHSPLALCVKGIVLVCFFTHMVAARLHLWTSRDIRHGDDAGISFLSYVLPWSQWRIQLVAEPVVAVVLGCVLLLLDPWLGATFVVAGLALVCKTADLYNEWIKKVKITGEPLVTTVQDYGQVNLPNTGSAYKPPRLVPILPARGQGVFGGILKFLTGAPAAPAAQAVPPGKRLRIRPSSPSGTVGGLPASPAAPVAPLPAPASVSLLPVAHETEYVQLLAIPPTGIENLDHLRQLWRRGLIQYHPDKYPDPQQKQWAEAMSKKLNAAYAHFKSQLQPAVNAPQA